MDIAGGVALVTGAASGLGLATTRRLVAEGAAVVMVDLPSSAGADAALEFGDRAVFVGADVTSESDIQAAVDTAVSLGELDIVVNCAGIVTGARVVGRTGPFPLELFRRTVEINLVGTFNVIRLAAAAMIATPGDLDAEERGVIISTASVAAFDGQIGQAAYSASKAGVAGITLPIARDLAQHRIRVMTIAPGLFHTPMFESLPPESIESLAASTPHPKRLGKPEEFADLVAAIVQNPMLNGETIRLDGAVRLEPR
ncbi:MAG: SDR family NAD(P)-dependent oxidoreductase [Herbiconiux sp.]|uniref:SDR family NAD(P)-dependent oxidoreductase n=1 Tax=Herbiconiux sp. TaxID=1871186 RepID=UPI0011F48BA9|nr:SDR family NAD(P)-dependent oxidoreductase [Herbiconiux sp.]TAJ48448.1 MAG: SDR family NAD(P)-dependent oxidoreductase [Herbiconiux sp.]